MGGRQFRTGAGWGGGKGWGYQPKVGRGYGGWGLEGGGVLRADANFYEPGEGGKKWLLVSHLSDGAGSLYLSQSRSMRLSVPVCPRNAK